MTRLFLALNILLTGSILLSCQSGNHSPESRKNITAGPSETDTIFKKVNSLILNYPDSARPFVEENLGKALKRNDPKELAVAYFLDGKLHRYKSQYPAAMQEYVKSLEICKNNGFLKLECQNNIQIGFIYYLEEKFPDAEKEGEGTLELADRLGDKEEIAGALNLIGISTAKQNKYDSAMVILKKALQIRLRLGQKDEAGWVYINIGNLYNSRNNYDSSLWYFNTALNLATSLNNAYQQSIALNNIGWLNHIIGKEKEAIQYEEKAAKIAFKRNDYELLAGIYENLGLFYAITNNFIAAYSADTSYTSFNDLVYGVNKTNAVIETQIKYETKEKEHQNDRLKLQINLFVAGLAFILLLTILLFNRNRIITKAKKKVETVVNELTIAQQKLKESEKELENKVEVRTSELANANEQLIHEIEEKNKAEAELIEFNKKVAELQMTSLRLQMNPHFIFNSLNSIQHFIYNNNKEEAAGYLAKFSSLIRQILEHANENTIVPADDLKMLQLYLELEMLRFDHKFEYELDIDPDIDIHNIEIPSMLIQPFVENAILHGLVPKENGKGKIIIRLRKNKNSIECIIEDNGIGRDKSVEVNAKSIRNKKSLGIKVSRERLAMLNTDEENEGSVAITDLKDLKGNPLGTRVEIRIPID